MGLGLDLHRCLQHSHDLEMTADEYNEILQEYPQFKLPLYHMLDPHTAYRLDHMPKDVLIARRFATLLIATDDEKSSIDRMTDAARRFHSA